MTGRYPRYEYPKWFRDAIQSHGREDNKPPARGVPLFTLWRHVLTQWDGTVGADMHQFYGIDLLDEAVLRRPWWWLRARILGLLDIPESRLTHWVQEVSA